MSNWQEEQAKHKSAKRGITELRPVGNKSKKKIAKPWEVWSRPIFKWVRKDHRVGRYATREQAEAWIEKSRRSYYMTRQDQSQRALDEAKARAEKWASRYYIKGPDRQALDSMLDAAGERGKR